MSLTSVNKKRNILESYCIEVGKARRGRMIEMGILQTGDIETRRGWRFTNSFLGDDLSTEEKITVYHILKLDCLISN